MREHPSRPRGGQPGDRFAASHARSAAQLELYVPLCRHTLVNRPFWAQLLNTAADSANHMRFAAPGQGLFHPRAVPIPRAADRDRVTAIFEEALDRGRRAISEVFVLVSQPPGWCSRSRSMSTSAMYAASGRPDFMASIVPVSESRTFSSDGRRKMTHPHAGREERTLPMTVADSAFLIDQLGQDCTPSQFVRELTPEPDRGPRHGDCLGRRLDSAGARRRLQAVHHRQRRWHDRRRDGSVHQPALVVYPRPIARRQFRSRSEDRRGDPESWRTDLSVVEGRGRRDDPSLARR